MIATFTRERVVAAFEALSLNKRLALHLWLTQMFTVAKTRWRCGTYAIKHEFASRHRLDDGPSGFYTSNDEFAGACLAVGFELEEWPGTFAMLVRPRSKRRKLGRRYVGRVSFAWWPADDVEAFRAFANDQNGAAA